jgi:hypothetical protein
MRGRWRRSPPLRRAGALHRRPGPAATDVAPFGEQADPAMRAARLHVGLAVIGGLGRGAAMSRSSEQDTRRAALAPRRPVQSPHIPTYYWPRSSHLPAQSVHSS